MTETLRARGTLRLWNAVTNQADRTVARQARRQHACVTSCYQARSQDTKVPRRIKRAHTHLGHGITAAAAASASIGSPSLLPTLTSCLPTQPPQTQLENDLPASLAAHQPAGQLLSCEQEDTGAQQLWQKFVLSRRSIVMGAGLGAGAALALWSGGLLAAPALHLAGFGVAGANAGTVAVAASLGPTLAASGVCAAACQGAGGAAALPLMSNAVLSAVGGSMLGGAGAASMALLLRGLVQGGQCWQKVDGVEESMSSSETGEALPVER